MANSICKQIHEACKQRETRKVLRLLKQYPDQLNCTAEDGSTPLITAAAFGVRPVLLNRLIERGASINATNNLGHSALYAGTANLSVPAIRVLISNGADLDLETSESETPLTSSIVHGRIHVMKLLISSGATIGYRCRDGGTPLYYAIYQRSPAIVSWLLEHGANPAGQSINSMSLAEWAIDRGNVAIARSLAKKLASSQIGRAEMRDAIRVSRVKEAALGEDRLQVILRIYTEAVG